VYNGGVRILLLNYEFPPLGGGGSPVSYEIAEGLSSSYGADIDVVTMGYKGLPSYEEVAPNLHVHRVRCLRKRKEISQPWEQLTYLVSAYFKTRSLLKSQKYDACHCHFIIPTGVLAWIFKKQFNLNYIISVHGSDVPGYNPDRFKLLHKFTRPFLKRICDEATYVVALSQYLKGLILENISTYAADKLVVIPNGIDPNKFIPLEKERIILSTGRLLPRKGFQYLIQAVSDEDIGYEVHIAGDGPMMDELQDLASKSKTKIVFHGWIDNKSNEYKELLGKAAIYSLVSEKENASIALLEAMSAGCAVITSDVSGCPETVGDAGIVIKSKDTNLLKNAIRELRNNPNTMDKLQRIARVRVQEEYGWERIVSRYANFLGVYSQG